jgi:hypothetical protein
MPHRPAPSGNSRGPDGADAHCSGHEHAEPRLPIAVVTVVVACAVGSVSAFLNAAMNESRAALPAGDVSVAAWVVSRATYPFKAAVALAVDSLCNGSSTATTPELILLMVTQSAADGLLEEPAAVELAGAEADVAGAGAETGADVADAVGVELDDELDEVHPAMRAPLAARTARTVSDERRDISGTSRGVEHERGSNSKHPKSCRKASPSH